MATFEDYNKKRLGEGCEQWINSTNIVAQLSYFSFVSFKGRILTFKEYSVQNLCEVLRVNNFQSINVKKLQKSSFWKFNYCNILPLLSFIGFEFLSFSVPLKKATLKQNIKFENSLKVTKCNMYKWNLNSKLLEDMFVSLEHFTFK